MAFALTCVIIEITPGPNMTYLAALSLSNGMRTGFAAVAGIALGLLAYGVIAALGLAALIDSSPLLYGVLRWTGVAYLLWLAWESWASEREAAPEAIGGDDGRPGLAFRRGLITNLLNPKAAVFYVAVLPEFVQVDGGPVVLQTLLLSVVYVAIATAIHSDHRWRSQARCNRPWQPPVAAARYGVASRWSWSVSRFGSPWRPAGRLD